jgi:RimJ/RimL family protein N-acetyltransferase
MLSERYPTILELGGLLADVPHDGYVAALAEAFAAPAAMVTLGAGQPSEAARAFVARSRAHWRDHRFGLWFLRDLGDGAFAGWAGIRSCEVGGERTVELAYALAPKMRCKGHAARIGAAALQLGFANLGLVEIVALTTPANTHALPVLERLDFAYDRQVDHAGAPHLLYRRTPETHAAGARV